MLLASFYLRGDVVVQDAAAYEELMRFKDRMETIAGIKKGLAALRKGESRPAEEVFAKLFNEFNISEVKSSRQLRQLLAIKTRSDPH